MVGYHVLERVRLGRTDDCVLKLLVILDVVKLYLGADVYGIVGKLVLADDKIWSPADLRQCQEQTRRPWQGAEGKKPATGKRWQLF